MKKALITATVQSHICQFHKPLVEILHENGYEVHVAARDNLAEKNGLRIDFVDKVYDIPFQRSPINADNIRAYKNLKRIISDDNYDIIWCNTPVGGALTRLAGTQARKKGTEIIYTAHGFHFYKGAPIKNWVIFYPIEKLLAGYTDKLVTITEEDYRLATKKFSCEVFRTHGVGVDENRFKPITDEEKRVKRKEFGYSETDPLIINVGELLPNKNQAMAIKMMVEVVKEYPKAMLLIAGNGPEKESLEHMVESLDLSDNVRFLGYCTNIEDYYQISDISVACSYREGLPLNVIEAMMCGCKVIGTDNRGHRELINERFIVEQNDPIGMAKRVIRIINGSETNDNTGHERINLYEKKIVKKELADILGYNCN